jgi:hypothetical protein
MDNRLNNWPYTQPIAQAAATATRIATASGSPSLTNSTATTAPDRPLTDPTDKSICPVSSTPSVTAVVDITSTSACRSAAAAAVAWPRNES